MTNEYNLDLHYKKQVSYDHVFSTCFLNNGFGKFAWHKRIHSACSEQTLTFIAGVVGWLTQQVSLKLLFSFLLHFQIEALQQSDKFKPSSPKETNFAFDYFFEKIQNEGEDEEEEEEEEGVEDRENEQASCSSQKEWRYLNIGH